MPTINPELLTYSDKYYDDTYEFRHVVVPAREIRRIPGENKLFSENEWRNLGIQQSVGWEHYENFQGSYQHMMFRRKLVKVEEEKKNETKNEI